MADAGHRTSRSESLVDGLPQALKSKGLSYIPIKSFPEHLLSITRHRVSRDRNRWQVRYTIAFVDVAQKIDAAFHGWTVACRNPRTDINSPRHSGFNA